MSVRDVVKQRETVIIDDDTVSDADADIDIPDNTRSSIVGAGIESSRAPSKQKAPQGVPSKEIINVSKTAMIVPGATSFVVMKTLSGRSLGSVEHYSMDWNNADMSEVSSANPEPRPHPAGSSNLARQIYAAKVAIAEADKAAMVRFYPYSFYFCN
jgi:hypothetical protein